MAFSQSFEMGNSTFMNIEQQVRHAIGGKTKDSESGLDIIQESPTKNTSRLNKTRSRIIGSNARRRVFRKSKSDTMLGIKTEPKRTQNYSEFFHSDFTLPEDEQEHRDSSFVRVSQVEAALLAHDEALEMRHEESVVSSLLDMPIFSEDVENMLENSSVEELWDDSLPLSAMPEAVAEAVFAAKKTLNAEMLVLRDESSFICPVSDDEAAKELTKQLHNSRRELKTMQESIVSPTKLRRAANKSIKKALLRSVVTASSKELCEKKECEATSKIADASNDLEALKRISAWNLPPSVLREYEKKGVIKMFDWQIECLSNPKVLFEHCNLVYSAPTSAGKTLVSEILLLKTVLERGKKALVILPFISVVREKMFYLQDLLTPAGYRVEGFFGGYSPPGGFDSIHVAICTIEKANAIVNRLLEQGKLEEIGIIVVDEVHLISDPGRGYILELLLAKILYMSRKYALEIQVITMSATLANVELLKRWLDAELYITDFRPVALQEMIKVGTKIYDCNMRLLRELTQQPLSGERTTLPALQNDADHVAQLCIETLLDGCSTIVFCPSKDWCENLALQLAGAIHALGKSSNEWATRLRAHIKRDAINTVKEQLRDIPTGLDAVLEKTITYACAFHHAGLTTEERDIIEASFKACTLKIIVATSTLSSGVNLPARRVLIRSPLFGGKQMSSLTYRQMIGRAGRTGKDTLGESILICADSNARIGRELISADLMPIKSCLELDSSTHLKRALLEVISSGVATTKDEIDCFVNCTLLSAQKQMLTQEKDQSLDDSNENGKYISDVLDFLIEYEFVRLHLNEETKANNYVATRLGMACLASSMPPTDGLILFAELQKSRRCFVLESELHAVYLVTPYSVCYQLQDLDWLLYLDMWEKLTPAMKKVGELVGVKESFLVRAMRGQSKLDYNLMQIHKRFYTALALQELVNETPINKVAGKYKCGRGMLQSLQQMASTFAGIVTAFCNSLQWSTLSLIVSQFKERLYFGIHRDLIDLMRLPDLSHKRARALYEAGITTLIELAHVDALRVEQVLYDAHSFDSAKQHANENAYETEQRNAARNFFITGKAGMTVAEAAKLLVQEARQFVQYELGVENIKWTQQAKAQHESVENQKELEQMQMSCEEENVQNGRTKRKSNEKELEMCESTPPKLQKDIEKIVGKITNCKIVDKPCTSKVAMKLLKTQAAVNVNSSHKQAANAMSTIKQVAVKSNEDAEIILNEKTRYSNDKSEDIKLENVPLNVKHMNKENIDTKARTKVSVAKSNEANNIQNKPYALKHSQEHNKKIFKAPNMVNKNNTPKANERQVESPTLQIKPRRSPRNHWISSTRYGTGIKTTEHNKSNDMQALFMADDESFEYNTGIAAALDAADQLNETEKHKERTRSPIVALNKSNDEIPSSQQHTDEAVASPRNATTRFLRSYRTQRMPTSPRIQTKAIAQQVPPKEENAPVCSSIEMSDLSMEGSLIKNPIQLNATHILSCSKVDTEATSFKCIEIIDICGAQQLLKAAFKELMAAERFGFSLGLQKHVGKRKPLIGGNLLINQFAAAQEQAAMSQQLCFQIDDATYVAGIAFSIAENIVYYMNMQDEGSCKGLTAEIKCKYLRMLLRASDKTLLMCDAKEQLKMLQCALPNLDDICVSLEDPKVANWLLQPDKALNLHQMAQQFAPECKALVNLCGSGRGYSSYGLDAQNGILAKVRCSIEACVTVHILKGQIENLERIGTGQLHKFFKELEMPLQQTLCNMEIFGFPAHTAALQKLFQQMVETLKKLESKIYEMHGARFNLSSSSAVAKVLGLHRKANGRVSTSKQILEKIDSPISHLIITYRKLSVALTKNIQPLLKCVQQDRIHGQSITYTATGRISMTEPNLQNVAKDFNVEFGTEKLTISCRSAFYPSDSQRCLISADFCQLEMRILAHLSQDKTLLQVMKSQQDLFTAIAARWNKISEDCVSEQLRNGTKQICYGIVYGMGMRSLAEALKCTEQEATMISAQFHAAYPGINTYAEKVIKFARNNGYVETITGRRRYLEHINSDEPLVKKQAERQAINSTVQGSAADIAKSAILRMEKNIAKYRAKLGLEEKAVRLVLHLHDELIFEVPEEKSKKIAKVLSVTMENCVKLNVSLKVKLKIGKSWGELRELKL